MSACLRTYHEHLPSAEDRFQGKVNLNCARYNLGRTYEQMGQLDTCSALYECVTCERCEHALSSLSRSEALKEWKETLLMDVHPDEDDDNLFCKNVRRFPLFLQRRTRLTEACDRMCSSTLVRCLTARHNCGRSGEVEHAASLSPLLSTCAGVADFVQAQSCLEEAVAIMADANAAEEYQVACL